MSTQNANIPQVKCYIRNSYIGLGDGVTEGYMFGVKCILNKPLLFHFQSSFGAVFQFLYNQEAATSLLASRADPIIAMGITAVEKIAINPITA